MRAMRVFAPALVLCVAASAALFACSSSDDSSSASNTPANCASSPFSCPAGQTCSAKDTSGAFTCMPSGASNKGDACQNTPGATTCGDGLVCLQTSVAGGQCAPYCEASGTAHPCASGEQCRAAALQGTSTVFYICVGGSASPADAGTDSPADAGTD